MPPFGLAHPILSGIHRDTEQLAAGVDPTDGHVLTWVDSLKKWGAREAAGGVTDHGGLTGLDPDDDHTQYALADRSRPSPWVAAADLAGRSIANLGTKDHDLLDGLGDDDHSIYALLAGRSGGQTLKGGSGASESLLLQSTAHATRGRVLVVDDLRVQSNIVRDSGDNERLTLATSSPEVKATGDLHLTGLLGVGEAPDVDYVVNAVKDWAAGDYNRYGYGIDVTAAPSNTFGSIFGVYGFARLKGSGVAGTVRGLDFLAEITADATGASKLADGVRMRATAPSSGPTSIGAVQGATIVAVSGMNATTLRGLNVTAAATAGSTTVQGIKVDDITLGVNRQLLEIGPAVPYFRVVGGWTKGAGLTPLWFLEGNTPDLRQLKTKAFSALLAADLVCIAV